MRKRTKRKLRLIFFLVIILIVSLIYISSSDNENLKGYKEYEIRLESELKEVNRIANKAWSEAYVKGKKDENSIKEYVEVYMKNNGIDITRYYFTYKITGVDVSLKHLGLLAKAGYYKENTKFLEQLKEWQALINTRGINVVEGRLGALRSLENITKVDVVIDESITEIKGEIADKDLQIGTLVIPNSVITISPKAFIDSSIDEIVLDANINELDGYFSNIKTLKKVSFTDKIKLIRGKTFNGTNIQEVSFIGSIEDFVQIKYMTFYDLPSHVNPCNLYINNILVDEIVIPDSVERIEDYALYNYKNITKITLSENIKYIGTSAFVGTSAKEIIYNGTKEMWNKISKTEEWFYGPIECTVYCIDGEIQYNL